MSCVNIILWPCALTHLQADQLHEVLVHLDGHTAINQLRRCSFIHVKCQLSASQNLTSNVSSSVMFS